MWEECGYAVFMQNKMNTDMIRLEALDRSKHLQRWIGRLYCHICLATRPWPFTFQKGWLYSQSCYSEWHAIGSGGLPKGWKSWRSSVCATTAAAQGFSWTWTSG